MPDNASADNAATETAASTSPIIGAEPAITLIDIGVVGAVLAVALWYLYRRLWARRGSCGSCGAKDKASCAVQRSTAAAQAGGRESGVTVPLPTPRRSKSASSKPRE
jgi:uncharacterized membrane protein